MTVRLPIRTIQFIDRSFRIKVLPQNDGIRNPIRPLTTEIYVNDTSNLAEVEKIGSGSGLAHEKTGKTPLC